MRLQNLKSKAIAYGDYKNFNNADFRSGIVNKLTIKISGGLPKHYLPKIHQKVKKLILLMMVKP